MAPVTTTVLIAVLASTTSTMIASRIAPMTMLRLRVIRCTTIGRVGALSITASGAIT